MNELTIPEDVARKVAAHLALSGYAWSDWFPDLCKLIGLSEKFVEEMRKGYE